MYQTAETAANIHLLVMVHNRSIRLTPHNAPREARTVPHMRSQEIRAGVVRSPDAVFFHATVRAAD